MRANFLIRLAFLCITAPLSAGAQARSAADSADTAHAHGIVLLDPGISLGRAVFLFPPPAAGTLPFSGGFVTSPEWGAPGPFLEGYTGPRADLMSPLRLQMARDRPSFWQSALGAVQLGAVGYMAYRHVKKYGLLR